MTRDLFERVFALDQIVPSGGLRSQLRIDRIADNWFSVVPVFGRLQNSMRMSYAQLGAVIEGFDDIDPKRIEPTIQPVLLRKGLKKENTTENYLYGFARAYLQKVAAELDPLPEEITEPKLFWEGAQISIIVNAYERSGMAKADCLAAFGTRCVVCSFSFGEVYGQIGDGFIHVHHLKPLASIGKAYQVSGVDDLRPVCPNCHAMLHRRTPPFSIEELKLLMPSVGAQFPTD